MVWRTTGAGVLLIFALLALNAQSKEEISGPSNYAVRAGWIYTLSDAKGAPSVLEKGIIIVKDGKIASIGADIEIPKGMKVYDFSNEVIIPGLVSAASNLIPPRKGLETVSSRYCAIDSFDPYGNYKSVLKGGVTTVFIDPGADRLMSGNGAVVKLAQIEPDDYLLKDGGCFCINLGIFGPPPLQEYYYPSEEQDTLKPAIKQRPTSSIGQFLELRDSFAKASAYTGAPFDLNLEHLAASIAEKPLLRMRAQNSDDIEAAVRWMQEVGLKGYIYGAAEAHLAVESLKTAGAPVVIEAPVALSRKFVDKSVYSTDNLSFSLKAASVLHEAGLLFAIVLHPTEQASDLMMAAAGAVRGGLSHIEALKAITSNPARILGVSDRVGSLESGKDADFLVLSGKPLKVRTHVLKVFSSGREVFSHPDMGNKFVLRAGLIMTAAGPAIKDGEILIEDGKIAAVGKSVPHPTGASLVDAGPDAVITPGFIDGYGHLGLSGEKMGPASDVVIADILARPGRYFDEVAASGITTVILAPYGVHSGGSQVAAIKTAGKSKADLVVDDLAALKFSFRNLDPAQHLSRFQSTLKSGKAYADAWLKYNEVLKKWKEEQKKKKDNGAVKKEEVAKKEEQPEKKDDKKDKKDKKIDPITGVWSFKLSGGPMPGPKSGELHLTLTGKVIKGFTKDDDEEEVTAINGTLNNKRVVLEIDVETPMGPPTIEADIDSPDHMTGMLKVGSIINMDFAAERIEKEAPKITVSSKKKKKGDGGPTPPKINPKLEPFRRLLAGEITALVDVGKVREMEAIIKVFVEQYKVPLAFLGAETAGDIIDKLIKAKVSVVVPPLAIMKKKNRPYHLADDLSRNGVKVILQSDAEQGASSLPLRAAYFVNQGMDALEALHALTINPAKLYRIDDRVGSIEKGKDADLIIFSGDPFEIGSRIKGVYISGKEVK